MDELRLDAESLAIPIASAHHLNDQYQMLVDALDDKDPGAIYDHSKTLLESVFRTIITNRNGVVIETSNQRATFDQLYQQACGTLKSHDTDSLFLPIVRKATKAISEMRNNHGTSSHGRDGYIEQQLMMDEALFVARITLATAGYFYSRHTYTSMDNENSRLNYDDNLTFNEYLDIEGDTVVAGISVAAPSRVLFDYDPIAYKEKLLEFKSDIEDREKEDTEDPWT